MRFLPILQLRFLEFLHTPVGRQFRDGDASADAPGIRWVLVDEYQDTNLIQEEIYLTLANHAPFNIVVVGDDDQAMYRFRGGSVECMVTFDEACRAFLGIPTASVRRFASRELPIASIYSFILAIATSLLLARWHYLRRSSAE